MRNKPGRQKKEKEEKDFKNTVVSQNNSPNHGEPLK